MSNFVISFFSFLWQFLKLPIFLVFCVVLLFAISCTSWFIYFRIKKRLVLPTCTYSEYKKIPLLKQILVLLPRRYVLDIFTRESDYFQPRGIHMFCGEQGCGKTISCVEYMIRLQKEYPRSKTISNFGLTSENTSLDKWQQLLDYNNGHQGVIVGIDEIQNWFMSGNNKLPEGMLEVVTQNRKNCRVLCCTAQVFTRVNKAIREQVTLVYEPHTFFGCFTIVIKYKPLFDSEGNVIKRKYRGVYSFVHTDELRSSYDTYKVIHTLSKEGFKDVPVGTVVNVSNYVKAK